MYRKSQQWTSCLYRSSGTLKTVKIFQMFLGVLLPKQNNLGKCMWGFVVMVLGSHLDY